MTQRLAFCLLISLCVLAGCNPEASSPTGKPPTIFSTDAEVTSAASTVAPVTQTSTSKPPSATAAKTRTPQRTPTPTATLCAKNIDWKSYTVKEGDTLELLADMADTTKKALMEANCLIDETLRPGDLLYTPIFIISIVPVTLPPEPTFPVVIAPTVPQTSSGDGSGGDGSAGDESRGNGNGGTGSGGASGDSTEGNTGTSTTPTCVTLDESCSEGNSGD